MTHSYFILQTEGEDKVDINEKQQKCFSKT